MMWQAFAHNPLG